MAPTWLHCPFCMAGMTFSRPILAVLKIPQLTFFMMFAFVPLTMQLFTPSLFAG